MGYEPPGYFLDGDALRRKLTEIVRSERNEETRRTAALDYLKGAFQKARQEIMALIESRTLPGLRAARTLSDLQDVLIRVLYDLATKHFYYAQNPTESEALAIVATGGYGRSQLAPCSDIDLLFLRPFKRTAWDESVIEFVLLMLWDLGLKVGHAARSLPECVRLARKDMTVRTALLDARFIRGDAVLCDEFRRRYREEIVTGSGEEFVAAKLAEREARHRKQGESRYLVEPNLKDGKGGLRDLQTLRWIAKYLYGIAEPAGLVDRGVFTREECKSFQAAEAFLWEMRCQLHCLAGRAEERLSFDVQPELAHRLGYSETTSRRAVERFMRAYFLTARDVGNLTRIFCAVLEEQNRKPRPPVSRLLPGFLMPRAGEDDFYVENGRLAAREDAFAHHPANLIRIFHLADVKHVDVHPRALRMVARSLGLIGDSLREDCEANRLFLQILASRHDPERALRRMNEAGVLSRFVPAFEHAVGLMQFNMYHHYTVDEHLVRAVGVLGAIERGELKDALPLASELVHRIKSREALYCAVFLHDIAKGMAGSHSEVGAQAAEFLCPRWGLSPENTDTVVWLVRNHLLMSDTAQRRDISDPKTVRDFVAAVQSPEHLRLLLVLTVADIRAVGPGVWNGWKAQLLRDLYHEAETLMCGAAPARGARVALAKDSLARRLSGWPEAARDDALAHHHENYWLAFDEAELERHTRLRAVAKERKEPFALETVVSASRDVCEITICTPDHPGLFAQLAGAIAASGGSIVEAKAFTADDGLALDVFSVQNADGGAFNDPDRLARLRRIIVEAIGGGALAGPTATRRIGAHRAAIFEVRPRVNIDNNASAAATVVEVEGPDRAGLLFDVASTIFDHGLSISSAIVATYGERVVDVFYVRDAFGHKVTCPERLSRLDSDLMRALEGAS